MNKIILAQETTYKLLQPLPLGSGGDATETTAAQYITGIFMLAIALAGVLAVVMLIFGGIRYMSTDAFTEKNDAKNTIQNALWGFVLAIGAWLILNTINPDLLNFNVQLQRSPTPTYPTPTGGPVGGGGPSDLTLTQQQAMNALSAGGVTFVGGINLNGIRQGTVDELIALHSACGCSVTVTSATGGEHNSGTCSHANGYKADIRSTGSGSTVKSYIESQYQYVFTRSDDGARVYSSPSGALYAVESSHIDMAKCT